MNPNHCENVQADRDLGKYWEQCFCDIVMSLGRLVTAHQIGRNGSAAVAWECKDGKIGKLVLPDVTIWKPEGSIHHEIKHKEATQNGYFGLEQYRFEDLVRFAEATKESVFYTIHDHSLNGGRDNRENHPEHWLAASVDVLHSPSTERFVHPCSSWVGGRKMENVPTIFWKKDLWWPVFRFINWKQ